MNAPQKRREFIFSPEVGETIDGPPATYGVTLGEVYRVEAFGRGEVEIAHLKLSPPHENEKAWILAMEIELIEPVLNGLAVTAVGALGSIASRAMRSTAMPTSQLTSVSPGVLL